MRVRTHKPGRILVGIAVLSLVVGACGGGGATTAPQESGAAPASVEPASAAPAESTAASKEPVVVCELAYYTGAFAAYGPSLTNDVRFPTTVAIPTG